MLNRTIPSTIMLAALMTATGCHASSKADTPFMLNEAALPKNFPKPGPIGQVVTKTYPAHRYAKTVSPEDDTGRSKMFRSLFRHIKKNSIAMTSPVNMEYGPRVGGNKEPMQPVSMAFYYASQDIGETGDDDGISVRDMPGQTVLSVGVRGSYSNANFAKGLALILAFMNEHADDYRPIGNPRYLGYNSPFVPDFMKYGEVQIPVTKGSSG